MIWVGFGPLFVAKEKGFFAQEGVEVELINMAHHDPLFAGLLAGQIDVSVGTLDECCRTSIRKILMRASW